MVEMECHPGACHQAVLFLSLGLQFFEAKLDLLIGLVFYVFICTQGHVFACTLDLNLS